MSVSNASFKSGDQLSAHSILIWRSVQTAVWLVGAVIMLCLVFFPSLGITLFWDILIPVAPALLVVATGVWRNVCPLASVHLLPRHLGLSKKIRIPIKNLGKLNLIGIIALYSIVPARHLLFNTNGLATTILISALACIAFFTGFVFEWKSAWCSGLCPVHSVEKLYGGNTLISLPNAHCAQCMNCSIPCPDSTPNFTPNSEVRNIYQKISGLLIIGGLPGFIWGWFHVQDATVPATVAALFTVYQLPLVGLLITLTVYGLLTIVIPAKFERTLISLFAAAGVSCYYWFRIPSLLGFGLFEKDGVLVNLNGVLPAWIIPVLTIAAAVFFFYWLVIRKANGKSWVIRPGYAKQ